MPQKSFLKFLKFITSLDYKTEIFDGDSYRVIIFKVKDFLNLSHSHDNSQDEYYKMQKITEFIRYLFYWSVLPLSLSLKYISIRNQKVG